MCSAVGDAERVGDVAQHNYRNSNNDKHVSLVSIMHSIS